MKVYSGVRWQGQGHPASTARQQLYKRLLRRRVRPARRPGARHAAGHATHAPQQFRQGLRTLGGMHQTSGQIKQRALPMIVW